LEAIFNNTIMNLDDDSRVSSNKKKMKARRSIDIEFHDHLDDNLLDELENLDVSSSERERISNLDDDLGDDSFGEASDSCEPDHEFLDQILLECHPERINLLDQTVPECVYNQKPRSRSPSFVSRKDPPKRQEDERPQRLGDDSARISVQKTSSAKYIEASDDTSAGTKRGISLEQTTEDDSESNHEGETEDNFMASPQRRAPKIGLDRTKMLGNMGKSTKKSLRTINGTFWSKPFKGLSQSIRRSGSAQGVADS
jgi:hypothetical protein